MELLLNGKSLGRKRNVVDDPMQRNRIYWTDIPYQAGRIEAVAYRDGEKSPVARHHIETAGKFHRLQLTSDNSAWKADGMDLQHVKIEALDRKSRRVAGADDLLIFSIEGPAEIVGVVNGDMSSDESMTGDSRSLYNGSAVVILRSRKEAGDVVLTVTPRHGKPVHHKMSVVD